MGSVWKRDRKMRLEGLLILVLFLNIILLFLMSKKDWQVLFSKLFWFLILAKGSHITMIVYYLFNKKEENYK
jgi:hypothetical protein